MKKSRTWVALIALIAVGAAAWFGPRWMASRSAAASSSASAASVPTSPSAASSSAPESAKAQGAAPAAAAVPPTPVEVMVVKPSTVQEELQTVGSLRSSESVMLRPEVSGRIARIGFRDGQAVKRGQLLIGLDASLNQAEVAKAQAELDLAQSNLKRTEDLARKNFVSGSAQETAQSNVEVLAASLQLAQARLSKMNILAPFDGVVGIRNVSVGDYVREGTDLINIEDVGTLKVDFRLPERNFAQVKVGQEVAVTADAMPNETWRGTLEAINPRVDANGRSLELRARLANSGGKLRSGMFVRVRTVVSERPNALMIPEEAIVSAGDDFFVFKLDGPQESPVARRIQVNTGIRRDAKVEIVQGLKAGDQVVRLGMRLSRDGQPVRVLSAAPAEAAANPAAAKSK